MADKIRFERDRTEEYEPTDSDEEYSEEEKELLNEVRRGREDKNKSNKKELMAFADSDDDDEGDDDEEGDGDGGGDGDDSDDMKDLMNDSDIEGGAGDDDDIPDSMDWGSKSRNYYHTDFIDPDYSAYTAEEAELAKQEEEEAKSIQQRLAKQMKEQDFLLDDPIFKLDKSSSTEKSDLRSMEATTKLKADFSRLTKREKQQLFQKDSPEFAALVGDFKALMKEVDALQTPILDYVKEHNLPMIPALQFTQVYRNLALTYCSNIGFYLLLKAKRVAIRNHPLTKRLADLKKLILQLQDKYENIIKPQLEALLERIVDGDKIEILETKAAPAKKTRRKSTKLSIMDQYNVDANEDDMENDEDAEDADSDEEGDDGEGEADDEMAENARRGITYEIAKNKGLTPHRKKEARNPRVKHRNKFRKALVRRKGAVRTVRKETKRYGGEISGIKSSVVKSVKFKV